MGGGNGSFLYLAARRQTVSRTPGGLVSRASTSTGTWMYATGGQWAGRLVRSAASAAYILEHSQQTTQSTDSEPAKISSSCQLPMVRQAPTIFGGME